jgi:hypothetical protein
MMNASYIDVFEASKVAYNFWLIVGIFMGAIPFFVKRETEKKNSK